MSLHLEFWEPLKTSVIWLLPILIIFILLGFTILRTKELRIALNSMNRMRGKVISMFDEQSKTASHLRIKTYMDPITGLGNQRYFKEQMANYLSETNNFKLSALFIIQIDELNLYTKRHDMESRNAVLIAVSEITKAHLHGFGDTALSRISGGNYAMHVIGINAEKAERLLAGLVNDLTQLYFRKLYDQASVCHAALVMLEKPQNMRSIFSNADQALSIAQSKGSNAWHRFTDTTMREQEKSINQAWLKHLSQMICDNEVSLLIQSVVKSENPEELLHQEVFAQIINKDGKPCPAGIFMVSAEKLGLSQLIDRQVIRKVVSHLQSLPAHTTATIAVNLTFNSLSDDEFILWVLKTLQNLPDTSLGKKSIHFELSEAVAIQNLDRFISFSALLRKMGHGLGLDQFGRGFSDFDHLKTLKPEYVKIDRTYTSQIEDKTDNQFFVSTLCNLSRSLEIQVIAQAVESQSQWDTLKTLHVDAIQGYIIDKPAIL